MWNKITELLPDAEKAILVFGIDGYGRKKILRAFYAPKFFIKDNDDFEAAEYCEDDDIYYLKEGFYEWNEHEDQHWFVQFPVTHWMELPEYPVIE